MSDGSQRDAQVRRMVGTGEQQGGQGSTDIRSQVDHGPDVPYGRVEMSTEGECGCIWPTSDVVITGTRAYSPSADLITRITTVGEMPALCLVATLMRKALGLRVNVESMGGGFIGATSYLSDSVDGPRLEVHEDETHTDYGHDVISRRLAVLVFTGDSDDMPVYEQTNVQAGMLVDACICALASVRS